MVKIFSIKRLGVKLQIIFLFLTGILSVYGVSGGVDLSFNAFPSRDLITNPLGTFSALIVQPDGKLLAFGGFRVVNGIAANHLVRFNTDGSTDNSFNCVECNKVLVASALLQPDGKIIIAGTDSNLTTRSKTIRINSDGSLDSSFSVIFPESLQGVLYGTVLFGRQSDGKIFIGHNASSGGQSGVTTYRLNINGSIDTSFTSFITNTRLGRGFVSGLTQLPDGKLYIYGATPFGPFAKLNANGTEDTSFEKPIITNDLGLPPIPASVRNIIIQSDGKVVIAGTFTRVNGLTKNNLTRINANGSVDLTFVDPQGTVWPPLEQFSDGRLLVLKRVDISMNALPLKLTADGAADTPLNLPSNLVSVISFEITPTNQIYIFGTFSENSVLINKIARLNSDGSLDPTFNASIANSGIVRGVAVQADGKVVMVGDFDHVNGISKTRIVRVNTDGSLDSGFDTGSGFDQQPRDVVIDGSGNLLVFGGFSSYNGSSRLFIARLLSNGSLDTGFNPILNNSVDALTLQPDGKILISGSFTTVNGQTVGRIARLNSDGSLDSSFNAVFGSGQINSIFVQTDGKIMVGGGFFGVNGFNRQNLVRLNSDGSLDNSFNAGAIAGVSQVAQISNGKYFVATDRIKKINSDGTSDNSYVSPFFGNTSNSSLTLKFWVLPNEGVVVIGDYNVIDSNIFHFGITALFPNGQLADQTYPEGTNGYTYDIVGQADGKIIIGGDFELIESVSRSGVARLNAPVLAKITGFDYDGDGKADISVFRPSENKWYILRSSDFSVVQTVFAIAGDIAVPADYDGDGKTDVAIFRPSSGDWWFQSSINNAQISVHFGQSGDIPLPSDFDGDGKTNMVVYRPSNAVWYRLSSSGQSLTLAFGVAGDKPLIGDFDGDGKSDVAIYRPSTGAWWYASSISGQFISVRWGAVDDIPAPSDYDGDGKTDLAVFRPSEGGWYVLNTSNGSFTTLSFGSPGDKPIAADYDGDGKADIAVFRPSTGIWYLLQSTAGFGAVQWGVATDIPTENAFIP